MKATVQDMLFKLIEEMNEILDQPFIEDEISAALA